jgi:peptidoglycan-associated lipoprotein
MRTRVWRITMFSVVIFAIGCVGCAKQPSAGSAGAPSPGRYSDGSAVYVDTASQIVRGPVRPSLRDFVSVPDLKDIHFAFDKADISPQAAQILDASAEWLKARPSHLVLVEGHTDERGTDEYNMALGDRRANASMNYLISRGVAASRFTVISYGEERGVCRDHAERCWSQNRRAHFAVKG